jgi:Tol biopolymer transport system component
MNHHGRFRSAAWPPLIVIACVLLLAGCQDGSGPNLTAAPDVKSVEEGVKPPPPPPADPAIAFLGGSQREGYGIRVANADGSNATTIFEAAGDPTWSPAGDAIAFVDGSGSVHDPRTFLTVFDVTIVGGVPTATNPRLLLEGGELVMDTAWSPLGDRIAFADGIRKTIESISLGGGTPEVLYTSESGYIARHPTWSPDATQIAFTEGVDGEEAIRILNVATGQATTVLDAAWSQQSPEHSAIHFLDWARTQDALVFQAGDGTLNLYIMQLPAGNPTFLVGGIRKDRAYEPSWSPDDREIIYVKDRGKLHTIEVDTQTITDLGVAGTRPDWRRF